MREMHVRCLLNLLSKCYLYATNVLYLCMVHMQWDWTSKMAQVTERPQKARCRFYPCPSRLTSPPYRCP